MRLLAIQYNPAHSALEVYVAGCSRNCPGCHNPETHDFAAGRPFDTGLAGVIADKLRQYLRHGLVSKFWILGGEPLQQDEESLLALARTAAEHVPVWLWTGAESIAEVPPGLLEVLSWVKLGPYKAGLPPREVRYRPQGPALVLASDNQTLVPISRRQCEHARVEAPRPYRLPGGSSGAAFPFPLSLPGAERPGNLDVRGKAGAGGIYRHPAPAQQRGRHPGHTATLPA